MKVRFLKTKRYPHPDGNKRYPGDEVEVADEVATLWEERGILEIVGESEAGEPNEPEYYVDPTAEPPESPAPIAGDPAGDLRGSTADDAAPPPTEVLSNFEPSELPNGYEDYGSESVDDIVAKIKLGKYSLETVLKLERDGKQRKGILELEAE